MSLEDTLAERGNTHGSFIDNAAVSQALKRIMRQTGNWERLTEVQKEALEVIAAKVSRILSGNANEPDHWHDIQGYARLAEQTLTAPTDKNAEHWKAVLSAAASAHDEIRVRTEAAHEKRAGD